MTRKAIRAVLLVLVPVFACCAIWLGYRFQLLRKPTVPNSGPRASNQPPAGPGKAVRRLPRWLTPITPHQNIQEELKKAEAAVKRNPRDPDEHFRYAEALEELGSSDAALEHYRLALKFPPKVIGRAYLYLGLGMALEKKGDMDGALAALQKSVVSWPTKHEHYCRMYEREALGQLLEDRGDYQGALQYWKDLMAVAKDPDHCREQYDRIRQFLDTQ